MMMYTEWIVEGYVGYTKHNLVLDGYDYPTQDSAKKAASLIMLDKEGLDPIEDAGLPIIIDIRPHSWVE